MKPARFDYYDPDSLDDALDLRARIEDIRPLAGGQSLMPMMNFRFVQPAAILDLNRIAALQGCKIASDSFSFGAMTRQRDIQRNGELGQIAPIIAEALRHVGHRQTRARGTIGGSLSHFDPTAELCNIAALHDAHIGLASRGAKRTVSFEEFGLGYLTTSTAPDEIVTSIAMRRWPDGHASAFEEFALRHGDFALCAVSCLLRVCRSGAVEEIALCVSGVGQTPRRLREFETQAVGTDPGEALALEAGRAASGIEAMGDAHVSAEYRTHLARVLTYRCVRRACGKLLQAAT